MSQFTGKVYAASATICGEVSVSGVREPVLEDRTFTENGEYMPNAGYDGIRRVTVDVEGGTADPVLQEKSVTPTKSAQNVTPDTGYDGLSKVSVGAIPDAYVIPSGTVSITKNGTHEVSGKASVDVDVPIPDGYIQPSGTKTISTNGTHDVGDYKNAEVNVPIPEGYIVPSGTKTISSNGTHDVAEYESALVDVEPRLQEKTATANGEFTPDSGYDGLSKVTVYINNSPVLQEKSVTPTKSAQSVTPDSGYDGLSKVNVGAIQTETKTATPTKDVQSITPTSGKYLEEVTVNAIPSEYIVTEDATATAGDILNGKTAYVDGKKVTGSIASKSASDLTASGAVVSVPSGYYPSAVSKSVTTATQATPSISVSSAGLITASATQTEGYVASGTKSATKQMTVQGAQTITPGTTDKTIASGRYLTGTQTIKGDANLVAANIAKGVSLFGVTGTHVGGITPSGTMNITENGTYDVTSYASASVSVPGIDTTITSGGATEIDIADGKQAYVNGKLVTGSVATTTSKQNAYGNEITQPSGANYLVVSHPFSSPELFRANSSLNMRCNLTNFGDATAEDVASGKTFTSAAGLKVTGTAASGGVLNGTVTPAEYGGVSIPIGRAPQSGDLFWMWGVTSGDPSTVSEIGGVLGKQFLCCTGNDVTGSWNLYSTVVFTISGNNLEFNTMFYGNTLEPVTYKWVYIPLNF